MIKCSFCSGELTVGTGKMFVKTDGRIFYFCSRKCEKNMFELKRISMNVRWTDASRKDKADRMRQEKK